MKTIAAGGSMTLEGDTGSEAAAVTVGGSPVAEDVNNRVKATVTVTAGNRTGEQRTTLAAGGWLRFSGHVKEPSTITIQARR